MRTTPAEIRYPYNEDGYEWCRPVDREFILHRAKLINGESRAAGWQPIEVYISHKRMKDGAPLKYSDSPFMDSKVLILRERAIAALGPMLLQYGELLPLKCNEAELRLYNVTNVLPALHEEASGAEVDEDGNIRRISQYVFRKNVVGENDIFKLKNRPLCPILLTHRFVELWRSCGLQGLEFKYPGTY